MKECTWLFGRGASIANGLEWSVPKSWNKELTQKRITRKILIDRIISAVRDEMDKPEVHSKIYELFINYLAKHTQPDSFHNLITTNWDYLLQRTLDLAPRS